MALVLKKSLVTFLLLGLSIWVIRYGMMRHVVDTQDYAHTLGEMKRLRPFAEAQYDYGVKAWYENRRKEARRFFQRAIFANVFHVDAWLKLAQVENESGNTAQGMRILRFTDKLAGNVMKWKWPQLLLARELGMEDIFVRNINFVIPYYQLRDGAFDLIDLHYAQQTKKVLEMLEPNNLADYLKWLMRRKRVEDSLEVWETMTRRVVDNEWYERYINFLVLQKEIVPAKAIRRQHTGESGLTNSSFEKPISGNAFGWRASSSDYWQINRKRSEGIDNGYAIRVDFSGINNVNFYHFRQIVPVQPGKSYELVWWWRSRNLTTEQRPFVEIYGYDCKSKHWKSEMIPANSDWRRETLAFTVPEACNAVQVRLRRYESRRFDSKIRGRVWLDDFYLEVKKNP
jgi:hypothetical protein